MDVWPPRSAVGPGTDSAYARDKFSYSIASVSNVDGYSRAVSGVSIDAIRSGKGGGASTVATAACERFVMSSCRVGFPMLSHTTISDDHVVVAQVLSVPPEGSRWCEIDLEPGSIVAWAPHAEHTAINNPGLEFTFVIANVAVLEEMASRLGVSPDFPRRGQVQEIQGSEMTDDLTKAFSNMRTAAIAQLDTVGALGDDVLRSITRTLTEPERLSTVGAGSRIDSRLVVRNCIDFAAAIERIPSVAELCLAAHVSERRLREAFTDEFDTPPTQFFRYWALKIANQRLRYAIPREQTVTSVAASLGFLHLGRFAGHYSRLYGEAPSATLRARTAPAANW